MEYIYHITLEDLASLKLHVLPGDRIFLYGDLGAGKTTFTQACLRSLLSRSDLRVKSPTYTYFQSYPHNIYHFDCYRLESFDAFLAIGAGDIIDDVKSICFIEWPQILQDTVHPSVVFSLESDPSSDIRLLRVRTQRAGVISFWSSV